MAHRPDEELIAETRNSARFFVENRHISWVVLAATVAWGVYGYANMPQRKDPIIPVRIATAVTPWPGIGAEKVEQRVTRAVEQTIAENGAIHPPQPGKSSKFPRSMLSAAIWPSASARPVSASLGKRSGRRALIFSTLPAFGGGLSTRMRSNGLCSSGDQRRGMPQDPG